MNKYLEKIAGWWEDVTDPFTMSDEEHLKKTTGWTQEDIERMTDEVPKKPKKTKKEV